MLKTRKNVPEKSLGSLNTCESEHDDLKQVDFLTHTVLTLRRKVYQLEQQLIQTQHFAYHDQMTGLPNRNLLKDRLNQALKRAARNKTQMGLLLLDLNGFKHVNDTLGHHTGDTLLLQVAQRLLSCIRDTDSVYRYGGDEFVVLLPEVDSQKGSAELMRKLQAHLARPYSIANHSVVVTASIGIAVYPTDGVTQKDLIGRADIAMYLKKNGKNYSHLSQ